MVGMLSKWHFGFYNSIVKGTFTSQLYFACNIIFPHKCKRKKGERKEWRDDSRRKIYIQMNWACCTYCIAVVSEPGSPLTGTPTGRGLSCCLKKYAAASELSLPYKQGGEAARVRSQFTGFLWLPSLPTCHHSPSPSSCCFLFCSSK